MQYMRQVIFVSATPGDWELEVSSQVVEQIVRPTGVLDPVVEVVPAKNQVDDLIDRLRSVTEKERERWLRRSRSARPKIWPSIWRTSASKCDIFIRSSIRLKGLKP